MSRPCIPRRRCANQNPSLSPQPLSAAAGMPYAAAMRTAKEGPDEHGLVHLCGGALVGVSAAQLQELLLSVAASGSSDDGGGRVLKYLLLNNNPGLGPALRQQAAGEGGREAWAALGRAGLTKLILQDTGLGPADVPWAALRAGVPALSYLGLTENPGLGVVGQGEAAAGVEAVAMLLDECEAAASAVRGPARRQPPATSCLLVPDLETYS